MGAYPTYLTAFNSASGKSQIVFKVVIRSVGVRSNHPGQYSAQSSSYCTSSPTSCNFNFPNSALGIDVVAIA